MKWCGIHFLLTFSWALAQKWVSEDCFYLSFTSLKNCRQYWYSELENGKSWETLGAKISGAPLGINRAKPDFIKRYATSIFLTVLHGVIAYFWLTVQRISNTSFIFDSTGDDLRGLRGVPARQPWTLQALPSTPTIHLPCSQLLLTKTAPSTTRMCPWSSRHRPRR